MDRILRLCWSVLLLVLLCPSLSADPGAVDLSFDAGTAAGTNCCSVSGVTAMVLQPNGQVIVAGFFKTNSASGNRVVRLNADGTVDGSFNIGSGADADIYAAARQSDGRILLAGIFNSFNGIPRGRICRLNPDGSVDVTFDPGAGPSGAIYAILQQPDGKVVVGGDFGGFNGLPYHEVALLNPDGSLDQDFMPGTGAGTQAVRALALQPDGKLLVGGQFTIFDAKPHGGLLRLNSDGTPDESFNTNPGANNVVTVIALQGDKILIGGEFIRYDSVAVPYMARLNGDGSIDPVFQLADGSSALGGVSSLAFQADGKMILGGSKALARFYPDGALDTNFNAQPNLSGVVYAQAVQPDGKVLVGGEFVAFDGVTRYHVARLEGDPLLRARLARAQVILSWPASYAGYLLEVAKSLDPGRSWLAETNIAVVNGSDFMVTNALDAGRSFYRLRH